MYVALAFMQAYLAATDPSHPKPIPSILNHLRSMPVPGAPASTHAPAAEDGLPGSKLSTGQVKQEMSPPDAAGIEMGHAEGAQAAFKQEDFRLKEEGSIKSEAGA